MKLIEKKCPNCGAGLEFNENDKSCKCSHCGSSYEIEREKNDDYLFDQYNLKPVAIASAFSVVSFIPIFLIVVAFIGIVGWHVIFGTNDRKTEPTNIEKEETEKTKYISNISELSNMELQSLNQQATSLITSSVGGESNTNHSYKAAENPTKEKMFLATKKSGNKIIAIYKTLFHDLFHQENVYTVYTPVVFNNIKNNIISISNGKIEAPEFYFNAEKTSYTYGYASIEETITNVVEPLKGEYKITEE